MEKVRGCTNFLKRFIGQERYAGEFIPRSLVVVKFSSQQFNGYFYSSQGLPGAVVQVTSHPAPFFILHPEKPL
jgi:hypothetical protein